ncbi:MAG: hemolysin family protein [Lachnospiraceae bacterium]|nr:hemolysin family protein [Lachnospiraceae bacterium]
MDPASRIQLAIILILLFLSAFFSSAETALMSVNRMKMRSLAESRSRARRVLRLLDNQSKLLTAILIGNNIVNLSASALTSVFAQHLWGKIYLSVATGVLTLVVIIFGEILPKTIAASYSERIAMVYEPVITAYTWIMTPFIFLINGFSNLLLRIFRIDPNRRQAITEDELLTVVEVSHEDGVLENDEKEMINNVVDFGDSLAKDVMVPRIDVDFASVDMTYDEVVTAFRANNYSRLPVYETSPDNVVGILFLKDLFHYDGTRRAFDIRSLMRKPFFTYEFKKTADLLTELRRESVTIAVVLDEYGSTAGIITLEDLLEEIVGEIRDEYDADEQDPIVRISDTEFLIDGTAKLDEVGDATGLVLASDDYDSIAGHIYQLLEHIPTEGESVTDENGVTYVVEAVDKNRIDKVRLTLPEPPAAEPSREIPE